MPSRRWGLLVLSGLLAAACQGRSPAAVTSRVAATTAGASSSTPTAPSASVVPTAPATMAAPASRSPASPAVIASMAPSAPPTSPRPSPVASSDTPVTAAASPVTANLTGTVHLPSGAVPGAVVRVTYADGQPLLAADGKPVQATADAGGAFGVDVPFERHAFVLAADAGAKGTLQALVPRTKAATTHADLTEASTLLAAGILDGAVKSQPVDPEATLDLLAPQALTSASGALTAAMQASDVPASLAEASAAGALTAIATRDAATKAQLDAIQRALAYHPYSYMAAGQATSGMSLFDMNQLAVGPDGALYVLNQLTIYRVQNGIAQVAVGSDNVPGWFQDDLFQVDPLVPGQKANQTFLYDFVGMSFDGLGRLLVDDAYGCRLNRVEPDGTVTRLVTWNERGTGVQLAVAGQQGETWLVRSNPGVDSSYRFFAIGPDDVEQPGQIFADQTLFGSPQGYGVDAQGNVYLAIQVVSGGQNSAYRLQSTVSTQILRLAPGDVNWTLVDDGTKGPVSLDPHGNLFRQSGDTVTLTAPGGSPQTVLSGVAADFKLGACAAGADGTVYIANGYQKVLRVKDGHAVPVMGPGAVP